MDQQQGELSPYRSFSREDWAALRADTPLTLTSDKLDELRQLRAQRTFPPGKADAGYFAHGRDLIDHPQYFGRCHFFLHRITSRMEPICSLSDSSC